MSLIGRSMIMTGITLALSVAIAAMPMPTAMAKKKKKEPVDDSKIVAEIEEALTPINTTMKTLMSKVQSRLLFTPKDSDQLESLKWDLITLTQKYPTRPELVQPIYQAAALYHARDFYQDAFDLYTFLVTNHPEHPYSVRAKLAIYKLNQKFGDSMFTPPLAPEVAVAPEAGK